VRTFVLSLSVRHVLGLVLVLGEKSWSWSLALKSLLTSLIYLRNYDKCRV